PCMYTYFDDLQGRVLRLFHFLTRRGRGGDRGVAGAPGLAFVAAGNGHGDGLARGNGHSPVDGNGQGNGLAKPHGYELEPETLTRED
ncbi:MAG: hypothetical protein HY329_02785, partial [Chloroflexi bacterium]|nr:hypothetical protein [Chloroflexota bacterium]